MAALGVLAWLTYRLRRYRFLGIPFDVATALLPAGVAAYRLAGALLGARGQLPLAQIAVCGLWAAMVAALRWRRYILFLPEGALPPVGVPLVPFDKVPLRASGLFQVGGQHAYYVEAAGALEATALGERIVMVEVRPHSFLGLLHSPEAEWGWWYIIFRPEEVQSITPGRLYFGWRPRFALRLGAHRAILAYLSFDDARTRDLVAADLKPGCAGATQVRPSPLLNP